MPGAAARSLASNLTSEEILPSFFQPHERANEFESRQESKEMSASLKHFHLVDAASSSHSEIPQNEEHQDSIPDNQIAVLIATAVAAEDTVFFENYIDTDTRNKISEYCNKAEASKAEAEAKNVKGSQNYKLLHNMAEMYFAAAEALQCNQKEASDYFLQAAITYKKACIVDRTVPRHIYQDLRCDDGEKIMVGNTPNRQECKESYHALATCLGMLGEIISKGDAIEQKDAVISLLLLGKRYCNLSITDFQPATNNATSAMQLAFLHRQCGVALQVQAEAILKNEKAAQLAAEHAEKAFRSALDPELKENLFDSMLQLGEKSLAAAQGILQKNAAESSSSSAL